MIEEERKEKRCQRFLKFIPIMFDPGAISVPGVLIDCGKNSKLKSSGGPFLFTRIPPKKGSRLRSFLRAVEKILKK